MPGLGSVWVPPRGLWDPSPPVGGNPPGPRSRLPPDGTRNPRWGWRSGPWRRWSAVAGGRSRRDGRLGSRGLPLARVRVAGQGRRGPRGLWDPSPPVGERPPAPGAGSVSRWDPNPRWTSRCGRQGPAQGFGRGNLAEDRGAAGDCPSRACAKWDQARGRGNRGEIAHRSSVGLPRPERAGTDGGKAASKLLK